MVHKTVSFEYLYYPGYWLAILDYKTAALWKPNNVINGKDLYDQGHIWSIRGGKDGSVYLQTARPGYINYFLLGYAVKIGKKRCYKGCTKKVYNTASAVNIEDNKHFHETFAFRILCQDCSTKQKCILWRLRDEGKLYSTKSSTLHMCRECGSDDWFNWRVFVHDTTDLKSPSSSNAHGIIRSNLFKTHVSITSLILLYRYYTA
jgi:hypothetical protein